MSNAHVSSSTLDFVGVTSTPAGPKVRVRPQTAQAAAPPRGRFAIGSVAETALYAGLSAGFFAMVYGLSTLLHF